MCQADLPLEMIPILLELRRALGEHVREHRDASLEVHEQGLLDALRLVAPRLLESMVIRATSGMDGRSRPVQARCPSCQQRRPVQWAYAELLPDLFNLHVGGFLHPAR